jgi:hypothetical protein
MYPSFIAMAVSAIIMLYIIIMLVSSNEPALGLVNEANYRKAVVLLLLATGIGIHGLAHATAATDFNFNPIRGQWDYEEDEEEEDE